MKKRVNFLVKIGAIFAVVLVAFTNTANAQTLSFEQAYGMASQQFTNSLGRLFNYFTLGGNGYGTGTSGNYFNTSSAYTSSGYLNLYNPFGQYASNYVNGYVQTGPVPANQGYYTEPVYSEPYYSEPYYTEPVYSEPYYDNGNYVEYSQPQYEYQQQSCFSDDWGNIVCQ